MRVLMISADRTLLGQAQAGDSVARHKKYADAVGSLDVIVFSSTKQASVSLADNLKVFSTGSFKVFHFRTAKKLAQKLIGKNPYDLLVTQDLAAPVGAKLKKQFNLHWIVSIHGVFWSKEFTGHSLLQKFLGWLIKQSLKTADGFRVNNSVTASKLRDWNLPQPILAQPTAIDVNSFFTDRNFNEPVRNILFVGRLSKEKNLPLLINAFKKLETTAELHIVGEGPEKTTLEKLTAKDSRIRFLGAIAIMDLPAIFKNAQIFVLPSNTETFGQVLLQAAASGCAIVATKTVGASIIIQDSKNGLLVHVGNLQELTGAIKRLVDNPALRESLGSSAQAEAKKYDASKAVANVVTFWKKIANAKTAKG